MISKLQSMTVLFLFLLIPTACTVSSSDNNDPKPPEFYDNEYYIGYWADEYTRPYRTDTIDPSVKNVPSDIQTNIFIIPTSYMDLLVKYLKEGSANDYQIIKRIHDWIADNINYDTDAYFSGIYPPQTAESVLQNKKGVCAGYSNLFKKLTELAGFNVVVINGKSKGAEYFSSGTLGGHAWNSVKINNRWYLIDVTWDSGYLSGTNYVKEYESSYLFLCPRGFIYHHFPDQSGYQFLNPSVSIDEFIDLPVVYSNYFGSGAYIESPVNNSLKKGQKYSFKITIPNATDVALKTDNESYGSWIFFNKTGIEFKVDYTIPTNKSKLAIIVEFDYDPGWYHTLVIYNLIN